MKTILFQGDSITDCGRNWEDGADMGSGYPLFIKADLGFHYPNEYKIYNRGVRGDRIVNLYARIKQDIINLAPDVMSILIGVNDVLGDIHVQNGVEAEKFYKIYSMLIEEIKEALPNIKIMILEPFALRPSAAEAYWDELQFEVSKRSAKAREIADKYNLLFVPLQNKFDEAAKLAPSDYWIYDGVHPTEAGHELIRQEWMKGFQLLMKES